MNSLTLTDVTLTYPDGASRLTALDRVSLTAPAGTTTAVTGPSGSGKSSLLAVAATLITPDSGRVVVAGTDTAGMSRDEMTALRRRSVGTVFQQPNLIASLTAAEQLQVMAHLDGRPPRAARGRAMDLLDVVGLADVAERRPHQLSGGQRQRVNIARALMNEPAVLLVDEPTSALDTERGAAVVDLLTSLTRERGTATVLVTHDTAHLGSVDAVVEVVDGRLRAAAIRSRPCAAPTPARCVERGDPRGGARGRRRARRLALTTRLRDRPQSFVHTETWEVLASVRGDRSQPAHRSLSRRPAR